MAVEAGASMDCAGKVVVHVLNNTAGPFQGQSATAGSWIVSINLNPGEAADYIGLFASQKSVDGYVRGQSVEGYVNDHWTAARPAECGAPSTPPPTPVDTTPHPLPTTPEDPVVYCSVPGANPPMKVPCDDPRATTPYVPPTPPTTAPVASTDDPAPETAQEPEQPSVSRTGPPRTHAVVSTAKPVQSLPVTGGGDVVLGGGAAILLALGALLVRLTRSPA